MTVIIVLVQTRPGMSAEACKAIEAIEDVQHAHEVTGPCDVIAYAERPSRSGFRRLVDAIHEAPGVTRTETCMSI